MKMRHVTIQTRAFEEELRFYQEIVGLKIMRKLDFGGRGLAFLADAEGDTQVEIMENPDAENAGNEFLSVGFHTDDVDALHAELSRKLYPVTPIMEVSPEVRFFFVTDPAGVRVQFI